MVSYTQKTVPQSHPFLSRKWWMPLWTLRILHPRAKRRRRRDWQTAKAQCSVHSFFGGREGKCSLSFDVMAWPWRLQIEWAKVIVLVLAMIHEERLSRLNGCKQRFQHYDDLIEHIPNSSLGLQRVANMSRIQQCQVKVNLCFKLKDGNTMEKLANDVLVEIKLSDPKLLRMTVARPFRAVWTDIKEYYLNLMIDTHYALPSMGTRYWNNRHRVMKAIYKSTNKIEFAEPPALAALRRSNSVGFTHAHTWGKKQDYQLGIASEQDINNMTRIKLH